MSWSDHQARALGGIFEALDAAGVQWLVLRNHHGLPESNRSKDVDLGLAKKDFAKAQAVVSRAARSAGFDRILVENFQYVRCLTFFGAFPEGVRSLKLDLLDGFVFRGAQLFEFSELWSASTPYRSFRIPHATDDGVMLWMKPLVTGGIVKSRYVPDILAAAQADPSGFRDRLDSTFRPDGAGAVWSRIEAGALDDTVSMKRALRRAAWSQALRKDPAGTVLAAVEHVVSEVRRRLRRRPATFVSVAGPDGVGKSTFIEGLAREIADLQVKDADAVFVRHFRPHVLPNIKELLTGKAETLSDFQKPHRAPPASVPSSLFRVAYYWADYVLGYWKVTRPRCIAGGIAIFDRYFYDFLVDPRRSRLSLPEWVTRAFLALTPKPDLVFILDADPDTIFARKQELSRDEIDRQLKAYRSLAQRNPRRFVRLNASQSPDGVVGDALRALVERSYPRIEDHG